MLNRSVQPPHTSGCTGVRDYRPVVIQDAFGFIEADHRAYAVGHVDWLFGETTDRSSIEF